MRKSQQDFWAGILFLAISGAFFVQYDTLTGVSRVFPELLISFIGLGGVYFVIKGIWGELQHKKGLAPAPQEDAGHGGAEEDEKVSWARIGKISLLSIVLVFAVEYIGFFVSTFVFLAVAYLALGSKEGKYSIYVRAILFALPFTAGVWLLFVKLLAVPTPAGILF